MSWLVHSFLNQVVAYGTYLRRTIHLPTQFRFFNNDVPQFFNLEAFNVTFSCFASVFLLLLWQL